MQFYYCHLIPILAQPKQIVSPSLQFSPIPEVPWPKFLDPWEWYNLGSPSNQNISNHPTVQKGGKKMLNAWSIPLKVEVGLFCNDAKPLVYTMLPFNHMISCLKGGLYHLKIFLIHLPDCTNKTECWDCLTMNHRTGQNECH